MKLGAVYSESVNALYRVVMPMMGLESLGHQVVGIRMEKGRRLQIEQLRDCDLVQIHRVRFFDDDNPIARLRDAGVLVSFDEDDDLTAATPEIEAIIGSDVFASAKAHAQQLLARLPDVDLVTTPSEALADRFEEAGAPTIEVIDNYLLDDFVGTNPLGHHGLVIGWHACAEHIVDAKRLGLAETLERILDRHDDVRVKTIGVDLRLAHDRYEASAPVPFNTLTQHLADFDIGIAPVADTPFGRARSNVKVREYAAAGVPWLASNIGPYAGLGKDHGGALVDDSDWFAALDDLVSSDRQRRKQAARARRWGTEETITSMAPVWEAAFLETIEAAQAAA